MDVPVDVIQAKELVEDSLLAMPGVTRVALAMREEGGELFDELAGRIDVDDATNAGIGRNLSSTP